MRLWSFYGDKQEFPTGTLNAVAGIAGDAMTGALDAAEFLDIDVYQSSRFVVFVAHDGLRGLQITPFGQVSAAQYATHSAGRHAQARRNVRVRQARRRNSTIANALPPLIERGLC